MIRLIDRYIAKEIFAPFFLGLLVLTLLLLLYQILRLTEWVMDKGISLLIVAELFIKLLPSFFLITIPMATAFAVLIAFNRLSCDQEGLALYACGVSFFRLLRPVFAFALVAAGMTFLMGLVASPWEGMKSVARRALKEKIGVGWEAGRFTEILPGVMIYAASAPTPYEMRHVFIYDERSGKHPRILAAREGSFIQSSIGEGQGIQLREGMLRMDQHRDDHQMTFATYSLKVHPARRPAPGGNAGMLSPEEEERQSLAAHKKYALAFAAFLFAFASVPLGMTSGKVGRIGVVLGMGLILFYYALTLLGDSLALSHRVPLLLAAWLPNAIFMPITLLLLGSHMHFSRPFFKNVKES